MSLPLSIHFAIMSINNENQKQLEHDATAWYSNCDKVASYLLVYYETHPERFQKIGSTEEVNVDGFASFLQTQMNISEACMHIKNGQLLDYVHKPFRYFLDQDRNGQMGPIMRGLTYPRSDIPFRGREFFSVRI